ncbi:MAG: GDSL-type esterase/lipase family protein [Treponema sp.]|jgi:lysophospholipase L1-like esterase|nr:GDSL-type esterase/lipase family protein [Treponema sp.]
MSKFKIFLFVLFFSQILFAGCDHGISPYDKFAAGVSATTGVPRQWGWWRTRHMAICALAGKVNLKTVFIGDSMTQRWEDQPYVWNMINTRYLSGNFGFGSDSTRQVIWRLENGEFPSSLRPKYVVLLIGSNNTGLYHDPPQMTAEGIHKIIEIIHRNSPETKTILLSILPRGDSAYFDYTNREVNRIIKNYHGTFNVTWYDIYNYFLLPNGQINKSLFQSDLGHLSFNGYRLMADKLIELFLQLESK